jgi:hypothetical protein
LVVILLVASAEIAHADGTSAAATGPHNYGAWCQARLTASWRHVLASHRVPLARTTSLVPFALAPDGRSFFAVVRSPSFSGVARIGTRAKAMTRIRAFPDPNDDQAGGSFDGRWLVWKEFHGFASFDDFTVYAWDSRTRRVSQIGAAMPGPDGGFWESPYQGPDVRSGVATWAQGSGADGLADIHIYDLGAGSGRVIHTGHAEGPFQLGHGLVAWPESPSPGAYVQMYVAGALSGKPVATPPALRVLRGVSGLDTDGRQIAYPSAAFKSLWWSPSLSRAPTEILAARGDNHVDNSVQVGGRYIGFGIQPRLFVADTKTRRYLAIEHEFGWTELNSASLLVDYGSNATRQIDYPAHVVLVPLRELPRIPACV